jgi:hypothetical protein
MKKDSKNSIASNEELISRKEAIIKTSKYVAFTALATFIMLSPKQAQAQSEPEGPGSGY